MPTACVLDYFAGSGTTGHAVIALNRMYGGNRKYILCEMEQYFDSVLLPRLKKAIYSSDWADGLPAHRDSGMSHFLKYIRLESYEDTLNNLALRRTAPQQALLQEPAARVPDGFMEQYILRYMLDVETRGSPSLLDGPAFQDPTAYTLKVKRPGSDETRPANVDLLETFNYLLGLTVRQIAAPQQFSAAFRRDGEKRLRLAGQLKPDPAGPWWFRAITGTLPDGRHALIIWRKLTGEPEKDNLVLDAWFAQEGYAARGREFDLVYVNGGCNLENLKPPVETWRVRLIEDDFARLMFDTEGV